MVWGAAAPTQPTAGRGPTPDHDEDRTPSSLRCPDSSTPPSVSSSLRCGESDGGEPHFFAEEPTAIIRTHTLRESGSS